MKKVVREMLRGMCNNALHDLAYAYQRYERPSDMQIQVELFSQRTPDMVNDYLSMRARELHSMSTKKHEIIPDELYVVLRCGGGDDVQASYLYGETYFHPPLVLPSLEEMRQMWEYFLVIPKHSGSEIDQNATWRCEFDRFVERKIAVALDALCKYEKMLDEEIVLLQYVLRLPCGVDIYETLYEQARRRHIELLACQSRLNQKAYDGQSFLRINAPQCMWDEVARQLKVTTAVLDILGSAKVPNTH